MKAQVNYNQKLNGIEITFQNKPSQEVLSDLKAAGFRWHRMNKYWYSKQTKKALEIALYFENKEHQEQPKEERSIIRLSKEEAFEVLKDAHDITPSDHMYDYYLKSSKQNYYFKLSDGFVIEFDRPSISKVLYYDDEYDAPSTDFENFKSYNIALNFKNSGLDRDARRFWIGLQYGKGSLVYLTDGYYCNDLPEYCPHFIRYITDQEKEDLLKAVEDMKKDYIKRLETYYKRYGKKVYAYGYWANR